MLRGEDKKKKKVKSRKEWEKSDNYAKADF
jgi:hypothetical protein